VSAGRQITPSAGQLKFLPHLCFQTSGSTSVDLCQIHKPLISIQHCVHLVKTVPFARRYGQPKLWTRDNASGYWTSCPVCAPQPTLPEPTPEPLGVVQPQALSCDSQTEEDSAAAEAAASVTEEADADVTLDQLLRQSLVLVEVEIPHVALMDGVHAKSFEGQLS